MEKKLIKVMILNVILQETVTLQAQVKDLLMRSPNSINISITSGPLEDNVIEE